MHCLCKEINYPLLVSFSWTFPKCHPHPQGDAEQQGACSPAALGTRFLLGTQGTSCVKTNVTMGYYFSSP